MGNPLNAKGNTPVNITVDNLIENGIYAHNHHQNPSFGTPENKHGLVIVFNGGYNTANGGNPILQVFIDATQNLIFFRSSWTGGWSEWKQIATL